MPVRSRENSNVKYWWEYNVITATETGWDINGDSGWDWTDVMWYIPCKSMAPADVSSNFNPAPVPAVPGEGETKDWVLPGLTHCTKCGNRIMSCPCHNDDVPAPTPADTGVFTSDGRYKIADTDCSIENPGIENMVMNEMNEPSPVPAPSGEGMDLTSFEGATPGPWRCVK